MLVLPVSVTPLGSSLCPSGDPGMVVQSSPVGLRVYGWMLDGVPARMDVLGLWALLTLNVVVFTLCG